VTENIRPLKVTENIRPCLNAGIKSSIDSADQKQILKVMMRIYESEIQFVWDSNEALNETVANLWHLKDT
jgi:hypothetical protein